MIDTRQSLIKMEPLVFGGVNFDDQVTEQIWTHTVDGTRTNEMNHKQKKGKHQNVDTLNEVRDLLPSADLEFRWIYKRPQSGFGSGETLMFSAQLCAEKVKAVTEPEQTTLKTRI